MNQNDKALIEKLAMRLKDSQPITKDQEAYELINQEIGKQPDSLYLLTQAVLLQEQSILHLKNQVEQLQRQPKKSGFLSSIFGNPQSSNTMQPGQPSVNRTFGQGSFLGSALSTAAGVAGGMMLFEGISHLFGGSQANASMLDNNAMNGLSDTSAPFADQSQLLNDGFGTGDDFGSSLDSIDSGDMSDWSDGFGGDF